MLNSEYKKWLGIAPLFKPEEGITIYEPPGKGPGYWIGAPGVIYDDDKGKFLIYYRRRRPRDEGADRGYECGISESSDGIKFNQIWTASKDAFGGISVERAAIVKTLEGKYRLYIGYVDPEDNRWKIDMVEANYPDRFDPKTKRLVLAPESCSQNVEGVKDPYILIVGGKYFMLVSYATVSKATTGIHDTADAFNTGKISSNTGLAISSDGIHFTWMGDVLSPGTGWNAYAARITCVLYAPPIFNVFYDGGANVRENYEEKTGLAISFDLMRYYHVSDNGPILVSPHASGSLRYMDIVKLDESIYYYYEYARPDGSHELRVSKVKQKITN
ncbi:hypothetical protein FJZ33_05285 [Candidatus Poribacteria bacterium]|nr:hypothetical protein [Candidatus Poribacteria bacterium]